MKIKLKTLIEATLGDAYNIPSSMDISGLEIDSRKVNEQFCFCPLLGETFDGHEFILRAFENGACVALCEKSYFYSHLSELKSTSLILVDNTTEALHRLGRYVLKVLRPRVIGITGSVGKTSTKEFVYHVLNQAYVVHKNKGNFNNHIGLPLTVLDLEEKHDVVILEMGMNHMKEIECLAEIAQPEIALITNIGTSHIGNLGSQENIFRAKLEITSYLKDTDALIVNGKDSFLKDITSDCFQVYKVGADQLIPYNVSIEENGCYGYNLDLNDESYRINLKVLGRHNIENSLLAFMVGLKFHMSVEEIIKGLEAFQENKGRLDIINLKNGGEIISDCYNASEDSMKSALEVLSSRASNYKIAILGDVLELGAYGESTHRRIGTFISALHDELITYGNQSEFIIKEAVERGFSVNQTKHFKDKGLLLEYVKTKLGQNPSILVKGSFGMDMIAIVNELIKE